MEKIGWVLNMILESLEIDQEGPDNNPFQSDECEEGKDLDLNTDTHYTLIGPCC